MELNFKQRKDRPNVFRAGSYKVIQYSYKWQDGALIPSEKHWGAYTIGRNRKRMAINTGTYTTFDLAVQACQNHAKQ